MLETTPPRRSWHLVSLAYPPQLGGVSDYTRIVAEAMVEAGEEVHIWAPRLEPGLDEWPVSPGTSVHRVVDRWTSADLARLDAAMDGVPGPRILVVQYTPQSWGYRGNLAFPRWLRKRARGGDEVRIMFHEVSIAFETRGGPKIWYLAAIQRLMLREALAASSMNYVSIPAWEDRLRPWSPRPAAPVAWMPIPSNIPVDPGVTPDEVAAIRARYATNGETIVGSFGTFGILVAPGLRATIPPLLVGRPDRVGLLFGRGSEAFADELITGHPELKGRLFAAGGLGPRDASAHLRAVDLLVHPYPDGLSARRGTLMAGLAHGVPIASNLGYLSEPLWRDTDAVALAAGPDPAEIVRVASDLADNPESRIRIGEAGKILYDARFGVESTVATLLGRGEGEAS